MTDFIKPRYRVIAIDETEYWDAAITAITGRIAGVYIVNFAEVTHICSMRGSYWAEFVCNITEHYVREPDGYNGGEPIWPSLNDDDDYPGAGDDIARGKALAAIWHGTFYGLQYEGASDASRYLDEGFPEPDNSLIDVAACGWDADPSEMSDDDAEKYRKERDDAARGAVSEYMCNGEDWTDIAPWNVEKEVSA